MICQPKFMWTNARHYLLQLDFIRNGCASRMSCQNSRNFLVQWNQRQIRLYTSQPKTFQKTSEGTRKQVEARQTTPTNASSMRQAQDIATELMHTHKGSIRRLKTHHLPPTEAPPKHSKRLASKTSNSPSRTQQGRRKNGSQEREKAAQVPLLNHLPEYSPTERIETLDTTSMKTMYTKQQGTFFHVSGSVFTIKSALRQFANPEPTRYPPFVHKRVEEYEQQFDVYNQTLRQREQQAESVTTGSGSVLESGADTTSGPAATPPPHWNASAPSSTSELSPPPLPPALMQFVHKPLRRFPSTPESLHAPYRVSVLSPKKAISKLAFYRTLCRRKFYQAIEKVFRGRARTGFDYMIFAGKDSLLTPQSRLEQLLIEALEDPRLHGERGQRRLPHKTTAKRDEQHAVTPVVAGSSSCTHKKNPANAVHASVPDKGMEDDGEKKGTICSSPRVRYRDDKRPPFKKFWKHALPDPLPRKVFCEDYLDRYVDKEDPNSPEYKRALVLRQRQGMWVHRRRVLNKENQIKAAKAAKEREKALAQHRAFVGSLLEKHFADHS